MKLVFLPIGIQKVFPELIKDLPNKVDIVYFMDIDQNFTQLLNQQNV